VVAQLGLNNKYYYAIDYMLGTIFLGNYLLYKVYIYLLKIDANRKSYFLSLFSKNDNLPVTKKSTNIQSAENCIEFSETLRQLSDVNSSEFFK
jgi:hypothetical protein